MKPSNFSNAVLFTLSLPAVVFSWCLVGLLILLGAARKPRWEACLVLGAEWRPWAAGRWGYSTTFGRAIVYMPDARDDNDLIDRRVEQHEHVHVRQVEDESLKAYILSVCVYCATGQGTLACVIWLSAGLWLFVHNLAAALRYGVSNAYRHAEHERSAYAQTDRWSRNVDKSWLDVTTK